MKRKYLRWSANNQILSKYNNNLVLVYKGRKKVFDQKTDGVLQRSGEVWKGGRQ